MSLHPPPPQQHGGGGGGGLHSSDLSLLAITNALRTGNPIVDLMLALSLPVVFGFLTTIISQIYPVLNSILMKFTAVKYCTRTITYQRVVTSDGYVRALDAECRNNILIKAIHLYLGELHIDLDDATVNLNAVKEDVSFDYDTYEKSYGTTEKQLAKYRVHKAPCKRDWVKVEKLEIMLDDRTGDNSHDDDEETNSKRTFKTSTTLNTTVSLRGHSIKDLDDFIEKAFAFYRKEMAKTQDDSRFLFTPISLGNASSKDAGSNGVPIPIFSQHKLSDEKTFDSLFLPFKDNLIGLLEKFHKKEGKFKIPGVKHRIGLLLHGPPGTGKTSVIKAIAAMLKRHIVTIPLARIKTNRELTQLMYDLTFSVASSKDEDDPIKTFDFKDVVFVMEDVDAASNIVLRRELRQGGNKTSFAAATKVRDHDDTIPPDDFMRALSQASEPTSTTLRVSEVSSAAAAATSIPENSMSEQHIAAVVNAAMIAATATAPTPMEMMDISSSPAPKSDKDILAAFLKKNEDDDTLNLAGLLNAIDGIVDAPSRVIILTSNHPEKLDPALVRPGRVDQYLHLDYIKANEAVLLCKHFFASEVDQGQFTTELEMKLRRAVSTGPSRTPAELEQLAVSSDTVQEFVDKIDRGEGWKTALFTGAGGQ